MSATAHQRGKYLRRMSRVVVTAPDENKSNFKGVDETRENLSQGFRTPKQA